MWSLGPGFQLMMINNNNDMVLKVSWGLCYHVQSSSREETGLVSQLFLTRLESLLSRILGLKTTLEPVGDIHQWTRFNSNQMITNISIILLHWDCGTPVVLFKCDICCAHTKGRNVWSNGPDSLIPRFWVTQLFWRTTSTVKKWAECCSGKIIVISIQPGIQSRIPRFPNMLCRKSRFVSPEMPWTLQTRPGWDDINPLLYGWSRMFGGEWQMNVQIKSVWIKCFSRASNNVFIAEV